MDITFNCDACEQSISIDEAGAGSIVNCPNCRARVLVPNKSTPTTVPRKAKHDTVIVEKIQGQPLTVRAEIVGLRVSWGDAWEATGKVIACLAVFALIGWIITEILIAIVDSLK